MGTEPPLRFVTASLRVEYIRPTPLGVPIEIRGKAKEIKGRKVVVSVTVSAHGEMCAKGEVIAVQMPEHMMPRNNDCRNITSESDNKTITPPGER
jgi:acyl-CoA thioesterase FadM